MQFVYFGIMRSTVLLVAYARADKADSDSGVDILGVYIEITIG